ncbi:phage baseplate protein [Kovacikia minuta CCNUW1]|uniref:T4 family baseplate hub assembly chaperone n=1 Tax=Kovacikia minuta TaxID=2931930 RepID=UPI001CC94EAD|nr:phage baseplate protein [Kovacikia minuta]UBF24841.1 phage baseplate protein [Kovacikia minuta CCNUW1]
MMRSLSAADILQIWEIGQNQHPLDRALTLLSFALPEMSGEDLVQLSIGQRDALLLTLRELTLGSRMESFAQCPQCQEPLEFTLNLADLRTPEPEEAGNQPHTLTTEGFELVFRLPTSQDLAAIVHCREIEIAQRLLAQRCIQQVSQNGNPINPDLLPIAVLSQIAGQIAASDPQSEMLLDLTCPACQHSWQVLFDIVSFFWTELSVQAKRLLREVHTLARFYGWHEADILSLSPIRRQFYLEQIMG